MTITLVIATKTAQTIAFGAAPALTVGSTGALNATASSGLAVTFTSTTTPLGGAATLSGGQATLTTSTPTFGAHGITAVYSGDAFDADSTSAALTQIVNLNGAQCAPQPAGIAGGWSGNDTPNDLIGGNNGTLVNGAGYAPGEVGDSFSLNGSNQYVLIGQPVPANLQIQNAITLSAWIYVSGPPPGNGPLGLIIGTQYDTTTSGATTFYDGRTNPDGDIGAPPGHIHFQIGDGQWHQFNALTAVPLNQWVLITATRVANQLAQIYYNGVLQPSHSTAAPWTGTITYSGSMFALGQQSDLYRPFQGLIDEAQIYSRALTPQEVLNLYQTGAAGMCQAQTASTTSLVVSSSTIEPGANVTLTATISPASATGNVIFMDGAAELGAPVPLNGGVATLSTATLASGAHPIEAIYTGDTSYPGSMSPISTITVLPPFAASPAFLPTAGAYLTAQTVTLTSPTPGASIYYTVNGSIPTTGSSLYTAPIKVTSSTTFNAIAVAAGYQNSPVASATYLINAQAATPIISPASGTYSSAQAARCATR